MPDSLLPDLAPTADVPHTRGRGPDAPSAYRPCPDCGVLVLIGRTRTGQAVCVEPDSVVTYVVYWGAGVASPEMAQSRGYPVHQCGSAEGTGS